jgi:hypothetical protein
MQGGDDPYIPRSWGGGCTADALYRNLRERGVSRLEAAQTIYAIIRTHPDVVTDPPLPAPLEVIPHPDSEVVTILAGKLVLGGSEVRVNTKRPTGIDVLNRPGHDQWDWSEARIFARGLYQRTILAGNADKLDIVAEVRVFFARKHGENKDGTDIVPSDSSLRDHVRAWREAGDYDL